MELINVHSYQCSTMLVTNLSALHVYEKIKMQLKDSNGPHLLFIHLFILRIAFSLEHTVHNNIYILYILN